MMNLRKAIQSEIPIIWKILKQAILRRKNDGSQQWQDGYPNENTILSDIEKGYGYVVELDNEIVAYASIIFDIEPAYTAIEGKWLTNEDYVVIHRVATSEKVVGKGVATQLFKMIEEVAIQNNVFSIKVDTNFDNIPMLKILGKLDYTYCGEVYFRGSARKAFEKIIKK